MSCSRLFLRILEFIERKWLARYRNKNRQVEERVDIVSARCNAAGIFETRWQVSRNAFALYRDVLYIIQSASEDGARDNDNPRIRYVGNVYSAKGLYPCARTCQNHRPFLAFCHAFLLQGVGPLYMRKWLGTTVTHLWRLTRLRRRPPRRVEETRIHAWKRRYGAKTRARISGTVKSILRNNGVRLRAFTSSVAIKYATQNRVYGEFDWSPLGALNNRRLFLFVCISTEISVSCITI